VTDPNYPVDVQFVIYRAASDVPRWGVTWNRYHVGTPRERIIGAAVTLRGWCLGLRWRRP
jgi:hypothetical protein